MHSYRQTGRIADPPAVPQRSFSSDYPIGTGQPPGSRSAFDIDGAALSPTAAIAGRTTVAGTDKGLRGAGLESAIEALGARIGQGTSSALGKDLGQYITGRGADGEVSRQILMRAGQPEAQYGHVLGHEASHLIDDLTFGRAIPSTGIRGPLDRLYSTENSALAVPAGKLGATPEAYGYKGIKADAERMAEAVRLYLRDPNYMKTNYPDVAKRIREYVNSNPNLKDVIQFNSAGARHWRPPEVSGR